MKEIKDLGFGVIQVNETKPTISKIESVDNYLCKWQKLKEWVKLQIDGLNEQLVDYDFDSDCREISIENFEIMLQQMQELGGGEDNDISKHFQIMLDNKDKRIADLQSQLDQANEIIKYKILLNDMETENSHLETMLNQANERLKKETEERQHLQCDYKTLLSHYNNLKESAIVPRFKRQEIVYCFSYGKIQLFNVVAYLDNQITLCENRETGKLEFVNNDYLCINEQEALAKLKEIQGNE